MFAHKPYPFLCLLYYFTHSPGHYSEKQDNLSQSHLEDTRTQACTDSIPSFSVNFSKSSSQLPG